MFLGVVPEPVEVRPGRQDLQFHHRRAQIIRIEALHRDLGPSRKTWLEAVHPALHLQERELHIRARLVGDPHIAPVERGRRSHFHHAGELTDLLLDWHDQLALDLFGCHALLRHSDENFGINHLGHQFHLQAVERNKPQQRNP